MYQPKVVDVYPYCKEQNQIYFLLMKRNPAKIYGGQWRMIGGKIFKKEKAWQAALREFKEETGLKALRWWTVPSLNQFYEHQDDCIQFIPVFAAECTSLAVPVLDDEHTEYKWVSAEKIAEYLFWPEQIRLIQLIDVLLKRELMPEWIIHSISEE